VTWSAKTAFTDTVPTTFAAVAIGSCVVVRDATAAVRASATPDPSATRPSELTAASVAVSAPVDGACTGRRVGGAGGGLRGTPPPGLVRPSASPGFGRNGGRAGGFGGGAFGEVVSKSANGFVVTSELPPRQGTTPGTPATTAVTTRVTTTAGTTYTTDQKVTATALKVGECVTARGAADTAGTVAATTIAIRAKTEGTCSSGFGRPRG
jgi:hypothetical protein